MTGLSATVGPGRKRYTTDEQRLAARRAAYRRNAAKQQALYYEICGKYKIPTRGRKWASHLAEIRHLQKMPDSNRELWRGYRYRPYHRWWLERYTLDEIHQLAQGIAL